MKLRYYLLLLTAATGCGLAAAGIPNSAYDSQGSQAGTISNVLDNATGIVSDISDVTRYYTSLPDYWKAEEHIEKGHYTAARPFMESFIQSNKGNPDIRAKGRGLLDMIIENALSDIGYPTLIKSHVREIYEVAELFGIDPSYAYPLIKTMVKMAKEKKHGTTLNREFMDEALDAAAKLGIDKDLVHYMYTST